MHSLEEISRTVRQAVAELELPARPASLYEPIRYTLASGGKRIRPLLALGSFALFSDELEKAVPAALAIEVFHNFTLLHDDLMDNSLLRRGRETVQVKWDDNTAILSGDAMLICAYELAARSEPDKIAVILPVLNRIFAGVCEGQQYDMDFERRTDVTADEYLAMIGLKTGVLMAGAMQVGAILAGADEPTARAVYEAGMHLGTAFQLQDDLLDTYGDAAVWGKNTGDDIADNKKTYLLIKALELAEPADKQRLLELTGSDQPDRDAKIEAVKEIYRKTGVKARSEELIEFYFRQATAVPSHHPGRCIVSAVPSTYAPP